MKNTTKWIASAVTAAAIFFATNVKAQTTSTTTESPWRLGIGLEAGIPTGGAHDISNFELGGTARLQYNTSSHFAVTLTSGYYNMFGKTMESSDQKFQSLGIVPVKAGIKAFFAPTWYFGAEAGAGFETQSNGDTKLIVSPALGYADNTWDVGVRYENFSGNGASFGLAGLRIAYSFGL